MIVAVIGLFVALGSVAKGERDQKGETAGLRCQGCVDSSDIANNAVRKPDMGDNSVDTKEIAGGAIGADEMQPDSVGSEALVDRGVGTHDLNVEPIARVTNTDTVTLAGGNAYPLHWELDGFSTWDSENLFDPDLDRALTAPEDGYYEVEALVQWEGHQDNGSRGMWLLKNEGATVAQTA